MADRAQHLAGLARLDGTAMRSYNKNDAEEVAAVEDALRRPWPKVEPDRKRHQPAPLKD